MLLALHSMISIWKLAVWISTFFYGGKKVHFYQTIVCKMNIEVDIFIVLLISSLYIYNWKSFKSVYFCWFKPSVCSTIQSLFAFTVQNLKHWKSNRAEILIKAYLTDYPTFQFHPVSIFEKWVITNVHCNALSTTNTKSNGK